MSFEEGNGVALVVAGVAEGVEDRRGREFLAAFHDHIVQNFVSIASGRARKNRT
jgi:hypothetical protein